jgi:heme/copper-type cytochrome/quinol oxidase subunit 2
MSLRGFHLLFIGASTLLALLLAGYCWRRGAPLGAALAVVVAAGPLAYGIWFRRKARTLVTAGVLWLLAADATHACESCYGNAQGPMIDGARMGVWLLVAVTLSVQVGFVAFFFHLRRRARQAEADLVNTEWTDLQRGPKP